MADTIFTSQTPTNDQIDTVTTRSIGMRWQTNTTGRAATSGRARVPAAGLPATCWWQLWDTTGPALLREVNLNSLTPPTGGTWMPVTFAKVTFTQSHHYIVCGYMSGAENYVFSIGQTLPVGSGGSVSADTAIFRDNGTQSQAPNDTTFTGGWFFFDIDVVEDSVTGTGSLAVPAIVLSAAGTPTVAGTAALPTPKAALSGNGSPQIIGNAALAAAAAVVAANGNSTVTASGGLTVPATSLHGSNTANLVQRPNTGAAIRPHTGLVTRPNTGIVTRP